jgi:biopolymer transport protein ExbD
MKYIPEKRKRMSAELLPLMDMIFLLLVIFIFMLVQMRPDFGVSVDLPDIGKTQKEQIKKEKIVTISITNTNQVYINDKKVKLKQFQTELNKLNSNKEKTSFIIKGDKKADYGTMVSVFEIMRNNKINNVIFDINIKK